MKQILTYSTKVMKKAFNVLSGCSRNQEMCNKEDKPRNKNKNTKKKGNAAD